MPDTVKERTRGEPMFFKAKLALEEPATLEFTRKFVGAIRTSGMAVEQSAKMHNTSVFGWKQKIEFPPAGAERGRFRCSRELRS